MRSSPEVAYNFLSSKFYKSISQKCNNFQRNTRKSDPQGHDVYIFVDTLTIRKMSGRELEFLLNII